MKILHIITGLDNGGAERQLKNLVRGSDQARCQHTVISLMDTGVYGIKIEQSGAKLDVLNFKRGKVPILGLFRLIKLIRRHRPDVIQTWLYHADLAGMLAAPFAGNPPVIWTLRCSDMRRDQYSPLSRTVIRSLRWLSRWPAAIIANSMAGMKVHQILGYRPRQQLVIPNGIDTEQFRPDATARAEVRAKLRLADSGVLIGCIARRDPMKDHAGLLQAFAKLPAQSQLLLIGKGTEADNPDLAKMITDTGLPLKRVICLGERNDVPSLMAALDGFVLSSAFGEGFPNSVCEAMACGIPGVVTDVGDAAIIIGDAGEVVPPSDPPALAAALARLIALSTEQRKALGEKARKRIQEHYPVDRMVEAYSKLYVQILSQLHHTSHTRLTSKPTN